MFFGSIEASSFKVGSFQAGKIMRGSTEVWVNFQALWSGTSNASTHVLSVSGSLSKIIYYGSSGAWITANTDGTFSGNSISGTDSVGHGTSGNLIRMVMLGSSGAWITFDIANGFSGSSTVTPWGQNVSLESSGGLIRARFQTTYGGYISLT